MSSTCTLSIITPVYNGAKVIELCLRNVIEQQCSQAEHIIVDGGSADGTVDIIKSYASRYPHIRWISEKDRGQSDAMNKGIHMAQGQVISFLNADDYYEPGVFNRVLPLFGGLPEPALVVGNCNIWNDDGNLIRVSRPHHLNILDLLLLRGEFPHNPTSYFYHRSLHDLIGPYNVDEHFNLDVEFIYDAVQHARVYYFDEVWGNFRMLKGSKTKDLSDSGSYWENYYRFREKYVRKLPLPVQYHFKLLLQLQQTNKWLQKKHRSLKYYRKKLLGSVQ